MVKKNNNKPLIIGLLIVAAAGVGIYSYYTYSMRHPSTDNAYINANLINVAAKVSGYIAQVYVQENQVVHKGDLLLAIDPQDYTLQLTQSRQDLVLAKQQASNSQQQIVTARANVTKAQSDSEFARQMAKRYTNLYQQQAGSEQDMQKYVNQANQAKLALEQAKVALAQATILYQAASTQIELAATSVSNAKNNNGYTQLRAAADGYISNLNLQRGEYVLAGQKLFGLVASANWWVDGNFKETQLRRIKIGQPAEVELDMYEHKYHGTVQSISYASGNTFSLLPAENATGNWVKVTQRFTVRIKLNDDPAFPLRVGASTKVVINTAPLSTAQISH